MIDTESCAGDLAVPNLPPGGRWEHGRRCRFGAVGDSVLYRPV